MDESDYKICAECGGKMMPSTMTMTFQVSGETVKINNVYGYFCCECGENVFTAKEIRAVQKLIDIADAAKTKEERNIMSLSLPTFWVNVWYENGKKENVANSDTLTAEEASYFKSMWEEARAEKVVRITLESSDGAIVKSFMY